MESKINLREKECCLKMSAAIPRIYRQTFNSDIITGMNDMQERLMSVPAEERVFTPQEETMLENLAYLCHRHADPTQPDDILQWLSQFEIGDVDNLIAAAIRLWNEDNTQLSTAKKKTEEQ